MEYRALATVRTCFDKKWVHGAGEGFGLVRHSVIINLGSSCAMVRMRLIAFQAGRQFPSRCCRGASLASCSRLPLGGLTHLLRPVFG
jgi:hypothetical protein